MIHQLQPLRQSFYRRGAKVVAEDLLGKWILRRVGTDDLVMRIVETEAYLGTSDRASHAWNGRRTERTSTLYRSGACAYVYLVYGLHHCLNAVTGSQGEGEAVLIRAGEPVSGEKLMMANRNLEGEVLSGAIGGGPGKLCQALAIDRSSDGTSLLEGNLVITAGDPVSAGQIATGPRVGIDYAQEAVDWPLRFALRGNPHVSRPRIV